MGTPRTPRRPVELEMVGGKSKRQRLWEAIRNRRQSFTLLDVACAADLDMATTRTYLQSLERGGFIEQCGSSDRPKPEKIYCLIKDNGLEAPRLTRDGKPVIQGQAREQMWRTMRMLGRDFNYHELAVMASTSDVAVTPSTAKDYLKNLAHAGYVTVVAKGKGQGAGGVPSRYSFNLPRYTGPRPPMVQRTKSIFDPNIGKVVWQEEVNDDDL